MLPAVAALEEMEVDKSDDLWKVLTGEEKLWLEEIVSQITVQCSP